MNKYASILLIPLSLALSSYDNNINVGNISNITVEKNGSLVINGDGIYINGIQAERILASGDDISGSVFTECIYQIEASQGIKVLFCVDKTVAVDYIVPESLYPYLEITCDEGVLKCRFEEGKIIDLNKRQVTVYVTAPYIEKIEAYSSADIAINGAMTVENLYIDASSGASIFASDVTATTTEVDARSGSSVVFESFSSAELGIGASSGADVKVIGDCVNTNIESSSGANVKLFGNYDIVDFDASSGSLIDALNTNISTGSLKDSSGGKINISQAIDTPYEITTTKPSGITIR